jgi:hypothetical protein
LTPFPANSGLAPLFPARTYQPLSNILQKMLTGQRFMRDNGMSE